MLMMMLVLMILLMRMVRLMMMIVMMVMMMMMAMMVMMMMMKAFLHAAPMTCFVFCLRAPNLVFSAFLRFFFVHQIVLFFAFVHSPYHVCFCVFSCTVLLRGYMVMLCRVCAEEFNMICPTPDPEEAASFKSRKLDLSLSRSARCVRQGQLCTHAADSSGSLLPGSRWNMRCWPKKWGTLSLIVGYIWISDEARREAQDRRNALVQ